MEWLCGFVDLCGEEFTLDSLFRIQKARIFSVSRMINDLIVTDSSPNHWSISAVWGRWEMFQQIMSVVNRIYRTFVCSCSPALVPGDVSRCPPSKLETHAHIPNLSNDLEKRLFLMAIKDTITVPNHSPWGWIESYQWLWQLSITLGVYQSLLEGINPARHLDIFWPVPLVHHNGGFIVMLVVLAAEPYGTPADRYIGINTWDPQY